MPVVIEGLTAKDIRFPTSRSHRWRTLDLGGSAAIAYMLLVVTVIATLALVNLVRVRAREVL